MTEQERETPADVARDALIRNTVSAGVCIVMTAVLLAAQSPRLRLWVGDQVHRARRWWARDLEQEREDREVARFRRDIGDIARNLHREAP